MLDTFDSAGQRMSRIGQAEVPENMIERSVLEHSDDDVLDAR
jgi:hypothetical protein